MTNRRTFLERTSMLAVAPLRPSSQLLKGDQNPVIAEATFGRVRGEKTQGIKIFTGVPYGASTPEQNRFLPPRYPAPWTSVRDNLHYGPNTPQSRGANAVIALSRTLLTR